MLNIHPLLLLLCWVIALHTSQCACTLGIELHSGTPVICRSSAMNTAAKACQMNAGLVSGARAFSFHKNEPELARMLAAHQP